MPGVPELGLIRPCPFMEAERAHSSSANILKRAQVLPTTTMSFVATRAAVAKPQVALQQSRAVSSSPYGRAHVWRNRPKKLPNPCVPQFPQQVIRADGSTFTHYTTSPRSVMKLTRDTTNNPLWAPFIGNKEDATSEQLTGRLGRFNKRFDGIGGLGQEVDWMSEAEEEGKPQDKSG